MADEIKLKAPTVEQQVVVNINGEDKLKSFADTLDKISNNKNLQKYWKTQQDLINATADAYSNFQKKASKDNASELIKVTNALKAMSGTDLSHILPDFDKISKSMAEAQKVAGNIDSAFSVKGFKEAFDSFETLKAYGTDIQKLFSHFGVSSDIGELQQNVRLLEGEVEKLTRRLNNAKNANEELRNEFENFKVGSGFADKLDELDRLKAEMQNIRDEATQTFNQFLDANKINRYDWFSDDRFAEYFEKLENGTLTATDAIRRFKSEYSYLLEDSYKSSGDSFGLDQLQAFSAKLDSIFHQVEETSNKINDIISNGVIAKSVQNLSEDTTLSDSQRSIFGNILQDEESLKSITALFQKLIDETNQTKNTEVFNTEQFTKIESLFTSIESSLSSIKGVLVDVGDGEELSPLLKQLDNIREATSNIKLSLNLDLGNEVSERLNQKVSQSTQRQLEAYRKLFSAMKGTGKTNKEMLKFFEPDEASATELIGAYQGIIKRAEEKFKVGNSNAYKKLLGSTYDDLKKEIKNANAQLGRAENKRSENGILGDLFGNSKDLSGVIEQLNIIVSKLDEISVSAKGFAETFKNGLNVNASVEEIEKLTNRVKELESELAKIKTPTTVATSQESNISSENLNTENVNKATNSLIEEQKAAGELELVFRGLEGSINGFMSNSGRLATFFTTSPLLARQYADSLGGVYQAMVALGNSLDINAEGRDWNAVEYLGNGSDEASKKIIELRKQIDSLYEQLNASDVSGTGLDGRAEQIRGDFSHIIQFYGDAGIEYNSYIEAVEKGNIIENQENETVKNLMVQLYNLEKAYKAISDAKNNVYGTHTTDEFAELAKANGYDSVMFRNIKDSFDRTKNLTDVGVIFDENQVANVKNVSDQIDNLVSRIDGVKSQHGLNLPINIELPKEISKLEDGSFVNNLTGEIYSNVQTAIESLKELETQAIETEKVVENISSQTPMKDAFPNADSTASVEKIADGFKEVKQNTEQATEVTEKYQRVLSQVGELGVDAKVSAMYQRNDGQLESVSWKAKRDDQGQILYDKNGNIDYDFNSTVISKYEQLEKIITTADNKLRDLQKSLKDTQNLNSNASTKNIEEQIQYQKDYIQLLEQTVKAISQQDEYLLYEQQIIDARAKAEKEYNLNQGTKSDISNAKQLASNEQKRQKSIEQTNRLLNKQQIIIDGIEKSYNKAANNDLDKAVNSQSDLAELANKKAEIQKLINQLTDQDRNSLNEDDFLLLEKYIAEYKQLAKDKLKANNPSKQELGGQELDVLLANQVTQYNKLISQSEKYGDATKEITNELKAQRDLIAEQDKNGIYVARSKKADGSEITANDYYNARDNYKIGKSIFSSYETYIKSASNMAKQEASNIQAEWDKNIKAIQDYMDAVTKLNNLKAKDKGTGSEANQIELQTQNVEKLKQVAFEARQNLSSMQAENPDIIAWKQWVDMMELFNQASKGSAESAAKLKDVLDNIKTPSLDKYENKLASYQNKTGGYNATIARFNDGGWTSDKYLKNVQAVKDAVKKYEDLLNDIKAKGGIASEDDVRNLKEYESEIKKTISTVTNMSAEKGYNFVSGQKELDKIHKLLNENSKMSSEAKAKIKAYYKEIESGNPSMSLDRIHGEIMKIYNAEVEAGRAGRTLWDTMKNSGFHQIAAQMAGMFGVYDIINIFKQGANTLKEFDDGLTKISYTMDMTKSQLDGLGKSVLETANDIDSSIDNAMQVSQIYANMNTSAEEIKKLSEPTLILSNLTGFDASTVADDIQAVNQQFEISAEESMHIADVYDQISRNISVDYSKILELILETI